VEHRYQPSFPLQLPGTFDVSALLEVPADSQKIGITSAWKEHRTTISELWNTDSFQAVFYSSLPYFAISRKEYPDFLKEGAA